MRGVEASDITSFSILPGFKARSEGDRVRNGDQIYIFNVSTKQYLHISVLKFADGRLEANATAYATRWLPRMFSLAEANAMPDVLHVGDPVRLFHEEAEGYLFMNLLLNAHSDMLPFEHVERSEVYLRFSGGDNKTTSSNTLWSV